MPGKSVLEFSYGGKDHPFAERQGCLKGSKFTVTVSKFRKTSKGPVSTVNHFFLFVCHFLECFSSFFQ
jgi:hypothetical protein